jgi:hypothetical protein
LSPLFGQLRNELFQRILGVERSDLVGVLFDVIPHRSSNEIRLCTVCFLKCGSTPELTTTDETGWEAGISIEETDEGFVVLADRPGFDREELSVRLHDDILHLHGEHEVGEGTVYRSRRVSERITLPEAPDDTGYEIDIE